MVVILIFFYVASVKIACIFITGTFIIAIVYHVYITARDALDISK